MAITTWARRCGTGLVLAGMAGWLSGCSWCDSPSNRAAALPAYDDAPATAAAADPYCSPCNSNEPIYTDGGTAYTADPYATTTAQPVMNYESTGYLQPASYDAGYVAQPATYEPTPVYPQAVTYAGTPAYDTPAYEPAPRRAPPPAKIKGKNMAGADLRAIVYGQPPNHVLYLGTVGAHHEVRYSGKGDFLVPARDVTFRRQFTPGAGQPYLITPYEMGDAGFMANGYAPAPVIGGGTYVAPAPASYPVITPAPAPTVSPSSYTGASDPYNQPYPDYPVLSESVTTVASTETVELASAPATYGGGVVPTSDEVWY